MKTGRITAFSCVAGCLMASALFAVVPTEVLNRLADEEPVEAYVTLKGRIPKKIHPLMSEKSKTYNRATYIDPTDGLVVFETFSDDRRAVFCAYHDAKKNKAVSKAWFKTSDVFDIDTTGLAPYTPENSCLMYRLDGSRSPLLYGVARGGVEYETFGKLKFGRLTYVITLLPCDGKEVFDEYTPKYRIALLRERTPYSDDIYEERVNELLAERAYTPGLHWDNDTHPRLVAGNGNGGCAAYVTDFVKYIFDKNNFNTGVKFDKASEIRSGDVIRIEGHYIAIAHRKGNKLVVADGNCNHALRQTSTAYSMANGDLKGGKFVCGWHYYGLEDESLVKSETEAESSGEKPAKKQKKPKK